MPAISPVHNVLTSNAMGTYRCGGDDNDDGGTSRDTGNTAGCYGISS